MTVSYFKQAENVSRTATHENVKVSFFGTIGFGRVGRPELTEGGVLQVTCLDDMMATKVKVILQRADEAKDCRDIAAMVNAGVSLPGGLAAGRQLYGVNFQPSESLKAMVYFEDSDLATLTRIEKSCLVEVVSKMGDLSTVTQHFQGLMYAYFSRDCSWPMRTTPEGVNSASRLNCSFLRVRLRRVISQISKRTPRALSALTKEP